MLILWLDCDLEGEAIGSNEHTRNAHTHSPTEVGVRGRTSQNPCSRAFPRLLTAAPLQATK
jgi:hypothetical protein